MPDHCCAESARSEIRIERFIMGVTYRCQCDCVHCSQGGFRVSRKEELTLDEIKRTISAASRYQLKECNLFGGEALLRRDIFDILAYARPRCELLTLDTNGVGMTPEIAERLREVGVDLMHVSLFSAEARFNEDLHRRKGVFDEIMNATDLLVAAGIPVYYSVCVFRPLLDGNRLQELIDLARAKKASGVRLLLPLCSGYWHEDRDQLLSTDEKQRVSEHVDGDFVFVSEDMDDPDFGGCGAVYGGSIFVSPYGDVQPCNFVPVWLGNVRQESLENILARSRRHIFLNPRFQGRTCPMMTAGFLDVLGRGMDKRTRLYAIGDYASVDLAPGCNNGCAGCSGRTSDENDAPFEATQALLAGDNLEYTSVWLRGGEPFLSPHVHAVIGEIAARGLDACAVTNARLFTYEKLAARAAKSGLSEAHVPIWGQSAAEYDAHVQVDGAFQQLIEGLRNLLKYRIDVTAYVDSRGDTSELVERLRSAGVRHITSLPLESTFYCDPSRALGRFELPGAQIIPDHEDTSEPAFRAPPKATGKRVLLVVPPVHVAELGLRDFDLDPVTNFPLALLKMATKYRNEGFQVGLLDGFFPSRGVGGKPGQRSRIERRAPCGNFEHERLSRSIHRVGLTSEQIEARLLAMPSDISRVLISSIFTYSWQTTWEMVRLCKKHLPNAEVVIGGIYPTLCPDHAAQSGADEVVSGPVAEIAEQWIDLDLWQRFGGRQMSLKSTYGCVNKCSYCAVGQLEGRFRTLDSRSMIEQLELYIDRGLRELHFWDSDLLGDLDHLHQVLDFLISSRRNLSVSVPSGFSLLRFDQAIAAKMRQAGFDHIIIPLETTREDKLREFRRRHLSRRFEDAVESALAAGFPPERVNSVIMVGYPGQTSEDVLADLAAVVRTGTTIDIRVYTPIPGTDDYERHRELFAHRPLEDLDSFLFPLASPALPAQLIEDVYMTFNLRRISVEQIQGRAGGGEEGSDRGKPDMRELFAALAERF